MLSPELAIDNNNLTPHLYIIIKYSRHEKQTALFKRLHASEK
jgi:hypothetical protein